MVISTMYTNKAAELYETIINLSRMQMIILILINFAAFTAIQAIIDVVKYYRFRKHYVFKHEATFNVAQSIDATEELASQAIRVQTTGSDGKVETQIIIQDVPLKETPRIAGRYASLARLQFGTMSRTAANQLMVREYIVRQMTERHVRKVDQARIIPFAVAFAFLPDRAEIEARKMMLDSEVQYRQHVRDNPFWTVVNRRWYNPFGQKVVEPMVPAA